MDRVSRVLRHDAWAQSDGFRDGVPFIIRFRTPVILPGEALAHRQRLIVLWGYADEGSGTMPDGTASDAMAAFENRLCAAWESDELAFLAAVLTFDGARQWVFYTYNVAECGQRLNQMPQEQDPYPIELTTESDPGWSYLHEQILRSVSWRDHQEVWESAVGNDA
jgi:hypothetical protein